MPLCKEQIMTFHTYRNVIKFILPILRHLVANNAIYFGKIRAQSVLLLHLTFCKLYGFKYSSYEAKPNRVVNNSILYTCL